MFDSYLADHLQNPENLRLFQQAGLQIRIAREVERAMKQQKISRKALAERMGVSKGRITQILSGSSNLTLRLVSDVFTALGLKLELRPVELGQQHNTSNNKGLVLEKNIAWSPKHKTIWSRMTASIEVEDAIKYPAA